MDPWPYTAAEHMHFARTSFMCMKAFPQYARDFERDMWLDLLHWARLQ